MNIAKLIIGFILLVLIPAHWFLGGLAISAMSGTAGLIVFGLWIAFFIGGISLIISGITENPEKKEVIRE
jgi:hypothetical protein